MKAVRELTRGASYALEGLRLVRRPDIRPHVIAPLVIDTLIFLAIFIAALVWVPDWIMNWFDSALPGWDWLVWIIWPLVALLALVAAAMSSLLLSGLVALPFFPPLAAAVLRELEGPRATTAADGLRPLALLRSELGKLAYALRLSLPLIVLSLIPVVQVLTAPFWFILAAWSLTLEFTDYALEHKGIPPAEGRQRLRQRRALALGFGAMVLLLSLIPLANLVVIPAAVAGATAMVSREGIDRLPGGPEGPQEPVGFRPS